MSNWRDKEQRGATLYAKLIDRLMHVGGTYDDLIDYTGLSYHTVMRYIKALREVRLEKRGQVLCPIVGWEKDSQGRDAKPIYMLKAGTDVPRQRLSAAQRQKRYRAGRAMRQLHSLMSGVSNEVQGQAGTGDCDAQAMGS